MATQPLYLSLPDLFHGRLFRVPDYQRGYAWRRAQLDALWGDLLLLDGSVRHFTGMVVVEKRGERFHDGDLATFSVVEVIDGQQRLTSLVLLMQAMVRALAREDAGAGVGRLARQYMGEPGWWTLELNLDGRAFFEQLLEAGEAHAQPVNASHRNLAEAVSFFRERVDELQRAQGEGSIRRLLARIVSGLWFVLYEVEDDAEAGLIFEVMNNRGKPLSEADRLKNYLMYAGHKIGLSEDAVKGVARSWGEVFKDIMVAADRGRSTRELEDRLLRNHWILYKEPRPPADLARLTISQRVRHELMLQPVPADERPARDARLKRGILGYSKDLRVTATHFAEIHNPVHATSLPWVADAALRAALAEELESFHRMGNIATALPLLLAGRRRLQDDPELYFRLVRALSRFVFRAFVICNHRSHTGKNHAYRLAHRLFQTPVDRVAARTGEVIGWVDHMTRTYGGDDEVVTALSAANFYHAHSAREIRYLFYEREKHLCHGQPVALNWARFSNPKETQVEHIWPKGREWFGRSKTRHDESVHRLGNLTVTYFNQNLAKRKFKDKKPIYQRSNLIVERELSDRPGWNLGVMRDREQALVEWALERWKVG